MSIREGAQHNTDDKLSRDPQIDYPVVAQVRNHEIQVKFFVTVTVRQLDHSEGDNTFLTCVLNGHFPDAIYRLESNVRGIGSAKKSTRDGIQLRKHCEERGMTFTDVDLR